MGKLIDLTAQRFGRLTVVELAGRDSGGNAMWACRCNCGNEINASAKNLKSGHTTSCGCLQREKSQASATSHGGCGTRLYKIWEGMKDRSRRPSNGRYKNYGGRGITVCEEWARSFEAFRDWALANGYRDDLTIEREDNDGNYCPENCHWATKKEQNNNTRRNCVITFQGESRTLSQWAELMGINYQTLWGRLHRNGWSVERALTTK